MNPVRLLSVAIAIAALAATVPAPACNVPVFRYALERWAPDRYQAVLFHDGPLTTELAELVNQLRQSDERGRAVVNIQLTTVDLRQSQDETVRVLWEAQTDAAPPWLVVRYPPALNLEQPLWSSAADVNAVRAVTESPARRELARRLLAGQSTVWMVIESGDQQLDGQVVERLEGTLQQLAATVQLPDATAQPGGVLTLPDGQGEGVLSGIPLGIEFSVLRVSRDDPAERGFLASILQTDAGLAAETGPIVLPIFGRGRALQAFPGADLDAETIREAVEFLCGACSCSVKAANPGMDLLLAAHWEAALGTTDKPAESTSEAVAFVPIPVGGQSAEPISTVTVPAPVTTVRAISLSFLIAVLFGFLLLAGMVVIAFVARSNRGAGS